MPRDGPTHERIDPHEGHNLSESLSDLFLREKKTKPESQNQFYF